MQGGKKENQWPHVKSKIFNIFAFGGKWVFETCYFFLVDS